MHRVTLFTRVNCHLCEVVRETIERVRLDAPFEFEMVDIDEPANEEWLDQYDHHVPVVQIDGLELARHLLNEAAFRAALSEPRAQATGGGM